MAKSSSHLPIPYALPENPDRESASKNYLSHRLRRRFLSVLGSGLAQASEDNARKIAEVNLRIGKALNDTLVKGFEGVQQQQIRIHAALIDQTSVLQQGFDQVELALEQGFGQVSSRLSEVSEGVEQLGTLLIRTGEQLEEGLEGLKASLDMGMVNIVTQFELQRSELKEGLHRLADLLENQHKTEARERFLDGKLEFERYLQHPDEPQFLKDAHDYLQQSLQSYRGNPYCHLYLGHIFQEASAFFDLEKSREHYRLCATYAKGMDNAPLAAFAYFEGAWICYVMGEVEQAVSWGKEGISFSPDSIPEAYFNLAKYHARLGKAAESLAYLDHAVQHFDPLYTLKANLDPDFQAIAAERDAYFERLRQQEAAQWEAKLSQMGISDAELS